MITAVIFDMDGVLIDSESYYYEAWRRVGSETGIVIDREFHDRTLGISPPQLKEVVLETFGAQVPFDELLNRVSIHYNNLTEEDGIPLKPYVREALVFISRLGLKMGVATSSRIATAEKCLSGLGLRPFFISVTGGDEVVHGKPAPDVYLLAATRLEVDPANCLAVEDSEAGTISASRAGMRVVTIPDLAEPSAIVLERAAVVFSSMEELPAYVIKNCESAKVNSDVGQVE